MAKFYIDWEPKTYEFILRDSTNLSDYITRGSSVSHCTAWRHGHGIEFTITQCEHNSGANIKIEAEVVMIDSPYLAKGTYCRIESHFSPRNNYELITYVEETLTVYRGYINEEAAALYPGGHLIGFTAYVYDDDLNELWSDDISFEILNDIYYCPQTIEVEPTIISDSPGLTVIQCPVSISEYYDCYPGSFFITAVNIDTAETDYLGEDNIVWFAPDNFKGHRCKLQGDYYFISNWGTPECLPFESAEFFIPEATKNLLLNISNSTTLLSGTGYISNGTQWLPIKNIYISDGLNLLQSKI